MKSIITIVALAIMASPSFAATTTKKTTKTKTTTTTSSDSAARASSADSSSTYSAHTPASHEGLNWDAGVGLGAISSTFAFGALVHGLVPVAHLAEGDILVGGETGFLYGPSTPSVWGIPIMAEGQFNFKGNGKITPYAGLAMGLGIWHYDVGGTVTIGGVTTSISGASGTSAYFSMLAKGGLYFGEEQKLYAELPLGTMGNAFAIIPSFGMRF